MKLIYLHLFTDCFMKISLQPSEQIQLTSAISVHKALHWALYHVWFQNTFELYAYFTSCIPMLVFCPGGALMPSSWGKGVMFCGWMATRTPFSCETNPMYSSACTFKINLRPERNIVNNVVLCGPVHRLLTYHCLYMYVFIVFSLYKYPNV